MSSVIDSDAVSIIQKGSRQFGRQFARNANGLGTVNYAVKVSGGSPIMGDEDGVSI